MATSTRNRKIATKAAKSTKSTKVEAVEAVDVEVVEAGNIEAVEAVEAVEVVETAKVELATRYADKNVAQVIAEDLVTVKDRGFTRPMLQEITGHNGSAVWRAQNGKVHPDEVDGWKYAINQINSGKITPPEHPRMKVQERVGRDALVRRNERAIVLLEKGDVEGALAALKGAGEDTNEE